MRSALASPRLRRILAAYTANRVGSWISTIALSLAVFDHTRSAPAVAAVLISAQVLPAFVVPALVARVEASPRRTELSGLYFFEAAATTALGILLWHFWFPAVLLLVALDGSAALSASALMRTEAARAGRDRVLGAVPSLSDGEEDAQDVANSGERSATAAINVAFSLTFVLGPIVGGALTAAAGAPVALFFAAASFLICGALLVDLRPGIKDAAHESVRTRLHAAWRHINDVPALRMLLLTQGLALVFFESAAPIEVAYVKTTLHAGDQGFGLLVTVWGVGALGGALAFARLPKSSLGGMLSGGTFAVGIAYVGFAAAPSLAVACVAALVGGLGNGLQWAPLVSAIQRLTPPPMQGRVMGAVESIGAVCPAIGLAFGGVLVAIGSPRFAFLVVGVGAALTTVGFSRVEIDERGMGTTDAGTARETQAASDGQAVAPATKTDKAPSR
jgi:MFS transporter